MSLQHVGKIADPAAPGQAGRRKIVRTAGERHPENQVTRNGRSATLGNVFLLAAVNPLAGTSCLAGFPASAFAANDGVRG